MDIGKFLTTYTKATSAQAKEEMIKKHVVATYIPFETKMAESQHIIDTTCYRTVNDKKQFWIDSPMRYMLFMKLVVMLYTDLEFDDINTSIQLNLLEQYGIFDHMAQYIGPDYEKFQMILNMTLDDRITNERSLVARLDSLGEATALMMDEIGKKIAETQKQ